MSSRELNIAGLLVKRGAPRRRREAVVAELPAHRDLLESCLGRQAWDGPRSPPGELAAAGLRRNNAVTITLVEWRLH